MCGVVGFSGKGGSREQFLALCKQSCIRGIHAFGAAWIDTGGCLRYVRSVSYAAVMGAIPDPLPDRIMFHNRYCTSGDYLVPENNQPIVFDHKHVALVFNGTVDMGTKEEMEARSGYSLLTENDGELVLRDCCEGEPFRRIDRETGTSFAGIVLGVHPDGSPYMYALRNERRPLWAFKVKAGYFIASTRDIASRAKLDTSSGIQVPPYKVMEL